jgi:hypothetical protein
LVECHGIAYNWSAELDTHRLIQEIGTQPVRTYIRAALETLDINYVYKETITPETTNLVEGSVKEESEILRKIKMSNC